MKAMLLAAGRGSRLRPLTDTTPKPLLMVGSQCLIEYNLWALKAAGIREVVINVSYYAKKIRDRLGDGRRYGLTIEYSFEEGAPLGTGGGIYQALPLLGDEPFIVISADVWSRYALNTLSLDSENDAHLVFVGNPSFHPKGDYALLNNRVQLQGDKFTYAGIAVLRPRFFLDCQPGAFSLSPLLNAAIKQGRVGGELYRGVWFNVGTLEELERLKSTGMGDEECKT